MMKSTNPWVWALVAILALFLAGCGGGSSNTGTEDMSAPEPTPVEKAEAAYDKAKAAEMAAMTARTTAKAQLDAAKKKGVYDKYSTGGDSTVARANAAAVIAAKAAAEKALADARAEKMKIDEALKALNALPAGTTGLEAQKKVVDQQSKDVAAQIKLIEGYLRMINSYAVKVDTEAKIKALVEGSPGAARSTITAKSMLNALTNVGATPRGSGAYPGNFARLYVRGGGKPRTFEVNSDFLPPTKVVVEDDSRNGNSLFYHRYDDGELPAGVMTWEQIAGAGNLVKKAFGTDNMDVDVLPLAGMPLSTLTDEDGTALTAPPTFTSAGNEQYYKGIKGTLYCQGTCNAEGGNLTGNLFFKAGDAGVPSVPSDSRYYWMEGTNSYYTKYVAYVRYGYWLYDDSDSDTEVFILADSPATETGELGASTTLPGTATYKGNALGLSALKTYTAGEHTGQRSAQFTADVTLNATFGDDYRLSGTINNFKGNAVDENWSVKLTTVDSYHPNDKGYIHDGLATGSRSGTAFETPGRWQAAPFSQDGVGRPAGVHGNFSTHFSNGHAAGAFSTRMQTK